MKKIGLLNTAIMSFNQGDYIIMESAKRELDFLLKDAFVVEIPTHSPMFRISEFGIRDHYFYNQLNSFDYKFLCGTNLLWHNMKSRKPTWNVNALEARFFKNVTLVGVGTDGSNEPVNSYTKKLYDRILNHDIIHSTRDERTKELLQSIGFQAINTGCVTMWSLTSDFCKQIPTKKSDNVVFTLTDYEKNKKYDRKFIEILRKNYSKLYFWVQGSGDLEYLESITDTKDIIIIPTLLQNYNALLEKIECDYVGTRLHAGIKALQKKRRSIIISIDNRALDISKHYNIPIIMRDEMETLEKRICNDFSTDIKIRQASINKFLNQFR